MEERRRYHRVRDLEPVLRTGTIGPNVVRSPGCATGERDNTDRPPSLEEIVEGPGRETLDSSRPASADAIVWDVAALYARACDGDRHLILSSRIPVSTPSPSFPQAPRAADVESTCGPGRSRTIGKVRLRPGHPCYLPRPGLSAVRECSAPASRDPAGANLNQLEVGQVLQDRYRIVALLGKGGMGAVWAWICASTTHGHREPGFCDEAGATGQVTPP
jgi:hypothetical protein